MTKKAWIVGCVAMIFGVVLGISVESYLLRQSFKDGSVKKGYIEIMSLINQLKLIEDGKSDQLKERLERRLNIELIALHDSRAQNPELKAIVSEATQMVSAHRKKTPFSSSSVIMNKEVESILKKSDH